VRTELPGGPYLVVGLARSGVAASLALRSSSEQVIGIDRTLPAGAAQLREVGVELHTDAAGIELLDRVHAVIKSPGVPREHPVIAAALRRGMPVIGELELAWRMLPHEFIAVTGTNGKTTTVELIGAIHDAAALPVIVAGNVGRALSGLVAAPPFGEGPLADATTIVCEASSFQLEDTIAFAPQAAVLLNLTADHLDRHLTLERYTQAKLKIFVNQTTDAIAVLPESLATLKIPGAARRVVFGAGEQCDLRLLDGTLSWHNDTLIGVSEIRFRGPVENAMAAAAVTLARGVNAAAVSEALRSFPGVAHRLEELGSVDGVLYVNDSKATNIASTIVALRSFAPGSVQLILGGQGKEQDFSLLREAVGTYADHTYLIGEDAERIEAALHGRPSTIAGTLERAVELAAAAAAAAPGAVVLLSPACASFDQFADFEARGERFRAIVLGEA
jgi:UDP-N-acetylmuramoylalanine--D-glutamate ligase